MAVSSVAEIGQLVQTLLEDKGRRTQSGDCISLIFSLACYRKKSWLAMASCPTAHRTALVGTHKVRFDLIFFSFNI